MDETPPPLRVSRLSLLLGRALHLDDRAALDGHRDRLAGLRYRAPQAMSIRDASLQLGWIGARAIPAAAAADADHRLDRRPARPPLDRARDLRCSSWLCAATLAWLAWHGMRPRCPRCSSSPRCSASRAPSPGRRWARSRPISCRPRCCRPRSRSARSAGRPARSSARRSAAISTRSRTGCPIAVSTAPVRGLLRSCLMCIRPLPRSDDPRHRQSAGRRWSRACAMSGATGWCWARSRSICSRCCSAARPRCCRSMRATCCMSAPSGLGNLRAAPAVGSAAMALLLCDPAAADTMSASRCWSRSALFGAGDGRLFGLSRSMPLSLAAASRCWARPTWSRSMSASR